MSAQEQTDSFCIHLSPALTSHSETLYLNFPLSLGYWEFNKKVSGCQENKREKLICKDRFGAVVRNSSECLASG